MFLWLFTLEPSWRAATSTSILSLPRPSLQRLGDPLSSEAGRTEPVRGPARGDLGGSIGPQLPQALGAGCSPGHEWASLVPTVIAPHWPMLPQKLLKPPLVPASRHPSISPGCVMQNALVICPDHPWSPQAIWEEAPRKHRTSFSPPITCQFRGENVCLLPLSFSLLAPPSFCFLFFSFFLLRKCYRSIFHSHPLLVSFISKSTAFMYLLRTWTFYNLTMKRSFSQTQGCEIKHIFFISSTLIFSCHWYRFQDGIKMIR